MNYLCKAYQLLEAAFISNSWNPSRFTLWILYLYISVYWECIVYIYLYIDG